MSNSLELLIEKLNAQANFNYNYSPVGIRNVFYKRCIIAKKLLKTTLSKPTREAYEGLLNKCNKDIEKYFAL